MEWVAAFKEFVRRQAEKNVLIRDLLIRRRERIFRSGQGAVVTTEPFGILNVELTNKCPMRCVMCARTKNMTRAQGFMGFSVFQSIVDQYVAVNPVAARTKDFWLHHFGESLMHPEFGKCIRYAVSRDVKAALSINPIMLSPAVSKDLLTSGIRTLYVSLDGHDDESFAKIRGVDNAFEKSKENLFAFLKLKEDLRAPVRVSLSMIDFKENRASIDKMGRFWRSVRGVDEFRCKVFTTWNGDAPDVISFSDVKGDQGQLSKLYRVVGCLNPWQQMSVAWDGDVIPCCYDYDKKYVLGNVNEHSLAEIWNGERMQQLRREFLSNKVGNRLCRDCDGLYPPLFHKDMM
ncbi:MAG: SPASM domain-containing protein [Candidatus Omnitrophica bacterium]|nr:SPASM domain-containing protein [Candidatus Omnitrophota bacterium]